MDKARFKELLEAYGARPERWPEEERAAAAAYLQAAPADERAERKAAAALDEILAASSDRGVDAALVGRVAASADRIRARPAWLGWLDGAIGAGARARLAGACVLLVVIGVAAGWASGDTVLDRAADETFVAAGALASVDDYFDPEDLEG